MKIVKWGDKVEQGILTNSDYKKCFEEINKRRRCKKCRNARRKFRKYDKKGNNSYSNLLPGFSSKTLKIPIDVLIVAEAHGGGNGEDFREQASLEEEVDKFAKYYLEDNLQNFHQQQMRVLLEELTRCGISWVFTDLIKCFVWRGSDNEEKAIEHCRKYLDGQISVLKPKKILSLRGTVTKQYFNKDKLKHGDHIKHKIKCHEFYLIYSYFPSRMTADRWVKNGGWTKILPKLKERISIP